MAEQLGVGGEQLIKRVLGHSDGSVDEKGAARQLDWDAMARLHAKGFISSPVGKTKSVALTEEGLRESQHLFEILFIR